MPDAGLILISRESGGNLVVNPPVPVWERSELTRDQLMRWSFLVAAAGRAMLDCLPQLEGGCINYWEAGNWALNEFADPKGPKKARDHRKVHLHLLGRSPLSTDPSWKWGESPVFPAFHEKHTWSARYKRLTPAECRAIVDRATTLLKTHYEMDDAQIQMSTDCSRCGYPSAVASTSKVCEECV